MGKVGILKYVLLSVWSICISMNRRNVMEIMWNINESKRIYDRGWNIFGSCNWVISFLEIIYIGFYRISNY